MRKRLLFLTSRVIPLCVALFSLASCIGQGTDQIHGMVDVAFPSTAVCQAQQRKIQFRNVSGDEIVIQGVAISQGTDPKGNFTLLSVQVGADETKAVAGILHDIHVPSGTAYFFVVTYNPRFENSEDSAVLDIAYTSPKEGITQVSMSGSSTSRAPNCPSAQGPGGNGAGDLSGNLTITITRIALATDALPLPISTDPANTVTPYVPVTVPITLNASANTVILPAIPESVAFDLPRSKDPTLGNLIINSTLVTSTADASGAYGDDGSLTVNNVPIHLKERFEADYIVTLTTGEVSIPNTLSLSLLTAAGFHITSDQTKVFGSVIDPGTHEVTLVGVGTFSNPSGTGTVANTIGGKLGAVVIEATIHTGS